MNLPDFLVDHPDGELRLTGHRIGLAHVVREYNRGSTAEMIAVRFPTIPLSLVHKVIGFYLENQPEVDAYVAAADAELKRLEEESDRNRRSPTLEELRRRLEVIRKAAPQVPTREGGRLFGRSSVKAR